MARTKMKIVGLGNRMQGVSKKNGKPYDFQPISFVYKDQYTTGYKAATSNVPGDMIDAIGGVKVDEEREIFFQVTTARLRLTAFCNPCPVLTGVYLFPWRNSLRLSISRAK